ncbi:carbohydrate kinase family protein [Candidatus Avoscillospira sp. LCP25S3_F1]|uniref:carbohydrate kinase family protein n=1 Tax=Candidatus Avoscillospira sp. LCP25S3_F1 TaxID=3438825 RepID=UPI003F9021B0
MDLYSIGEMVIDFIPGSEQGSYIRNAGGAPANVAIAAARNGLKSGMCCSVGDDDFGRFLMDTLKDCGVRAIRPQLCSEAITTMAFVTLAPDGDRSFTFARKPGADMFLSEADVKEEDIADTAIVHAGSCSLSASPVAEATVRALRLGREKNKLVSFDVNYRNLMWNDNQDACAARVFEILPYVDLLKISEEEVTMMGGEENLPALMERYHLTLIVETLGGNGARCFFQDKILNIPGRKAVCVDATGAGDAFWGGFLSSLRIQGVEQASQITEEILRKAMEYGNIAGWICVQSKGAIPSLPTRQQIEQYLG